MEEEHRKGTLRAIGVSNFEPRHIDQLLRVGRVTPAVNQIECHPYLQQRELGRADILGQFRISRV